MNIALLGYGKMGKELEKAAVERSHDVILKITSGNTGQLTKENLSHADVAIEFSKPSSVINNIYKCFDAGVPVVVGTTGWYDKLGEIKEICLKGNHTMLYASNFSIGVNIFFEMNRILARIMNHQPSYDIAMEEIHHTQKLDSPSGTALTLVNDIVNEVNRKQNWVETHEEFVHNGNQSGEDIIIHSKRLGQVVGTHIINYTSPVDQITIKHEAFSRAGFVQGALLAAEWLKGKKGFYTMQDIIQLK